MGRAELQSQINGLECGIMSKRASLSQADAKIEAINQARPHAVAARDEAEALVRTTSYFALAGWEGVHAQRFMRTVSDGGDAKGQAAQVHARCVELVVSMDVQLRTLQSERSSLQRSITQDQRTIQQARTRMNRIRETG